MTSSAYKFGWEDGSIDGKYGCDKMKNATNPFDEGTSDYNDYLEGYCAGYDAHFDKDGNNV